MKFWWILKNSLPKAITSGVANCFSSSKNFGTMITKWFWANHQLSTVLICLYQKPFASGLANSSRFRIWWADYRAIFGKLQAINGFEISLPRAVCSWISQSFCGLDMVDWLPFIAFLKCEKTLNFDQMGGAWWNMCFSNEFVRIPPPPTLRNEYCPQYS